MDAKLAEALSAACVHLPATAMVVADKHGLPLSSTGPLKVKPAAASSVALAQGANSLWRAAFADARAYGADVTVRVETDDLDATVHQRGHLTTAAFTKPR